MAFTFLGNLFSPLNKEKPKDKKIIIPTNYRRSTNRTQQTVAMWRDAIIQAENRYLPYRTSMITLYQDTILNSQVIACTERRKDLTMLREFEFVKPSGVADKNTYELMNKPWFKKFISYALDSLFYGYTLINLGSIINNEFPNLQITRREYVSPDWNMVLDYPSTPAGVDFTEPKYNNWNILVITNNPAGVSPTGYGLLYPVALIEIYLRNILGLNADYVELFTQPFRVAKTDKTTEEERDFLQEAIENFGSNGWVLMDKEDEIEFLETGTNSSSFDAYATFEDRLEKKISKIILGHADALDSTPGKLGATDGMNSPIAVALRDKKQADAVFIENIINNELIPRMNALGFNIKSKFQFTNDEEKQEEINYITDIAVKMSQAGLQIDHEYFTEHTDIPIMQAPTGATDTNIVQDGRQV